MGIDLKVRHNQAVRLPVSIGDDRPCTTSSSTSATSEVLHIAIESHLIEGNRAAHRVSGTITFDQVALDGNVQNFTCGGGGTGSCTRAVIPNANWQPDGLVVPNFQIDAHLTNGSISSPVKVYVDSFYIYYW